MNITLITRLATVEDAEMITRQRRAMFEDIGKFTPEILDEADRPYPQWVREKLAAGDYIGWFALDGDQIIGGAGAWLIEWQPAPLDITLRRAYILNVYTDPAYRGRGIARQLVQQLIDSCQERGIKTFVLHASDAGRPIYEKLGFTATNEMRLIFDDRL